MAPSKKTIKNESPSPSMSNGVNHKKRKRNDESSCSKRSKSCGDNEEKLNLVMFPDDVLLIILKNLSHDSLLQLKKTCTLFSRLCEDYTLWRTVNYTRVPLTREDAISISRLVNNETKSIDTLGRYIANDTNDEIIDGSWMNVIRDNCPELEKLGLKNHFIDCHKITMGSFPPSLTYLDLSNTYLRHLPMGKSYFKDVSSLIPNLKTLILSNCEWFEPHSLMAISKCKYLEELRLNDCYQVRDCLAYCGLSTRGGFRALKTLDLRRCCVTTSELVCFSSVPTLINLYLENIIVGGQYTPVFIDSAIMALCTRSEMELRVDGRRAIVSRLRLKVERLIVRHFHLLTDITLIKLARDALNLKYLDITGSGVTYDGMENFRSMRPDVVLINETR